MKKLSLALLVCLFAFFTACSNDDISSGSTDPIAKNEPTARFYGVKESKKPVTRGVAQRTNLWGDGAVITVKFLNETKNADLMNRIVSYAKEWEQYAGVEFKFVEKTDKALVRIGFDWNANRWVTWSYVGSDAKIVTNQAEATASFADFDNRYITEEEIRADVLRVFGQILGLEYEQRHLGWNQDDWLNVQKYWENEFEDVPWSVLKEYVVDPLSGKNIASTEEIDLESIMLYPYTRREVAEVRVNYELSAGDKAFIGKLYPQGETTIQKAWVDAGFFEWMTADNAPASWDGEPIYKEGVVGLVITNLGRLQEYLPNVIDGEQLTTGYKMFEGAWINRVPKFNTSNITDFSFMFQGAYLLREAEGLNTSKGTKFENMFVSCQNLRYIDALDTSLNEDFSYMFNGCRNLTILPELDTSNGVNFEGMFEFCESLKIEVFDTLDLTKGENFQRMFSQCKSLAYVSSLNMPNGINFEYMFSGCTGIQDVSNVYTPKGMKYGGMFMENTALNSINGMDIFGAHNRNQELTFQLFPFCHQVQYISGFDLSLATAEELYYFITFNHNLRSFNVTGFGEGFTEGEYFYEFERLGLEPMLTAESVKFIVDNTKGPSTSQPFTIHFHKNLESKVPAVVVANARTKNMILAFDIDYQPH